MINERVCEGCGDCGAKSNCLSVQPVDTEFGRKTRIDQSSCNLDFSCVQGDCPSFLEVTPGTVARAPGRVTGRGTAAKPRGDPASGMGHERDVTLRIAGIGGTGVVTVAQVLAVAAVIAGRHVRGMDQTGLAQKGGAVVSDLRITAEPVAAGGRLARGECDLYLGADLLVAADESTLKVTDPERTVAIVSTTKVPTGRMVIDTDGDVPRRRRGPQGRSATPSAPASGSTRGRCPRRSSVPISTPTCCSSAPPASPVPCRCPRRRSSRPSALNGVAVEKNVQAFRRGRQLVADPAALAPEPAQQAGQRAGAARPAPALPGLGAPAGSELARLAGIRVAELTAYQDEAYAAAYLADVERVRAAEAAAAPGSTALAEAVAANLHKLLAYKDEYEVARLSLSTRTQVARAVRRRRALLLEAAPAGAARARHAAQDHPRAVVRAGVPARCTGCAGFAARGSTPSATRTSAGSSGRWWPSTARPSTSSSPASRQAR